jgi:uncharacterized protein (TIGR00730 family)
MSASKVKNYNVCVFCGSKSGNNKKFINIASKLGEELSKKKYTVIYGGGTLGLMGALANSVLKDNGKLISIIPSSLKNSNILSTKLCKTIYTKDFVERKKLMIKKATIFIVLPGGFGTLDELFEVISLNQLKVINKKIILIDVDNFWNPLQKLLKVIYKEGFLYSLKDSNIIFKKSVNKTIKFIEQNI